MNDFSSLCNILTHKEPTEILTFILKKYFRAVHLYKRDPRGHFMTVVPHRNNVKDCKIQPHNFSIGILWSSRYLRYKFIYSFIVIQ